MNTPNDSKRFSSTLIKGLDTLSILSATTAGMTTAALVQTLNEPRSNVLRVLESLRLFGLIERAGRQWKVSEAFTSWASHDRYRVLKGRYRPTLERIASETGELVLLGLQQGNGVIHIDYIECDHVVRIAPAPDTRHSLKVNALGKLALSRRPDLAREIADKRLQKELHEIQRTGIAWNREESVQGMVALAHPGLRNTPNEPMIAVAWPAYRFSEKKARLAIESIRRALRELCG